MLKFAVIIVDERKAQSWWTNIEEYFLKYSNCFLGMQQSSEQIFFCKSLEITIWANIFLLYLANCWVILEQQQHTTHRLKASYLAPLDNFLESPVLQLIRKGLQSFVPVRLDFVWKRQFDHAINFKSFADWKFLTFFTSFRIERKQKCGFISINHK